MAIAQHANTAEPVRRATALFFSVTVFAVVLFKMQYGVIGDSDTFWHIKTGEWIVQNGQFPHADMFSHSFRGEPWIAKEWLSQLIFYGAYKAGGWKGVVLLTASAIFLTVWILSRFCLSQFRWSGAVAAMFVLVLFASTHFLARPLILAFPILLGWTIELANAADERRLPRWWMVPLIVLWANLHGGFTLGLLLAGIFSAETVLSADGLAQKFRSALKHGTFLAVLVLATLLNPYGHEALLITQKILDLSAPLRTIDEWQSPDFQRIKYHLSVVVGLLGLTLVSGFRLRRIRLAALLLLVYLMLNYTRSLTTFGLLLPIIIAAPVIDQFTFARAQARPDDWREDKFFAWFMQHAKKLNVATAVMLALTAMGVIAMKDFDLNHPRHPYGGVEFAKANNIQGNVLNDYSQGGYLIWKNIPPGIDGRAELYGNTYYERYTNSIFSPGQEDLLAFLQEQDISWTLLRPGSDAIAVLDLSPNWRCVYSDEGSIVHLRTDDPRNSDIIGSCDYRGMPKQ